MDRRARRTRNLLAQALMSLLREKPIKDITVRELTERADVNRATFYAHYHDVYDMFDQLAGEFDQMLEELVFLHVDELKQGVFEPMLRDAFGYMNDNEDVFLALLSGNAGDMSSVARALRASLIQMVGSLDAPSASLSGGLPGSLSEGLQAGSPEGLPVCAGEGGVPDAYLFDYVAGGLASLMGSWLLNPNREPVESIVPIAASLMRKTL